MNFINSITRQSRELFDGMTPQSRLMAILLVAAIAVSAVFLVRGTQTSSMEYILAGATFNETELYRAESALSAKGLKDYDIVGKRIKIPTQNRTDYVQALADAKVIPQRLGNSQTESLNGGNMFDSEVQRLLRNQTAKEKDIGMALEKLPFVDEAWVSYDEQREGFARNVKRTAAVYVKPNSQAISEEQARNIARQVESSFAGLEYRNIRVMDLGYGQSFGGSEDPMSTEEGIYAQRQQNEEEKLRRKAMNLLSSYGDVKVEVNVVLDPMLREATEQTKVDEKPVAISSLTTKKDSDSMRPAPGGRPGAEPNAGPNRSAALAGTVESTNKLKESSESQKMVAGQTKSLTERVGLGIERVTFAVMIPRSYYQREFEREWREENPKADAKDMPDPPKNRIESIRTSSTTKIQSALASLAPQVKGGEDKLPLVTVADYLDEEVVAPPSKTTAESAIAWLKDSWQTVAMLFLAMVALLVLRSAVTSQPVTRDDDFAKGFGVAVDSNAEAGDFGSPSSSDDENAVAAAAGTTEELGPIRLHTTGGQVREQLTDLVRNDPAAAVNILRTWIGDAA